MSAARTPYLIGIDVGTSGLKAVLIDDAGRVLSSAFREYAPDVPNPGWAEQEPEVWLAAAVSSVREMLEKASIDRSGVAGIGFSGQMHSTVFLALDGSAVRPAILWLDGRSAAQAASIQEEHGKAQLAEWIGNPVAPGFMLATLLWAAAHEPATWRRTAHVLLPKDYVRYRLTGEIHTDYSDASSTALLDVRHRTWARELLESADLPISKLPPLAESIQVVGHLLPEMARNMELPSGIPVICGAGDQQAQAVGNGIIRPGIVSSTIGTGGQLFAPTKSYQPDPELRLHTFCHAVPGLWHWEAAMLTAGVSLRWLRDEVLARRYGFSELAEAAATVEPGAEGLVFLPYLAGERTPHMDPAARGVFYGLTLRHSWKHMARAIMEGVVMGLLDGLELMRGLGAPIKQVVASGGAVRHPLWLQLQADIFGVDLQRTASKEAAALGAALLAGAGAGVFQDIRAACEVAVQWSEQPIPVQPETADRYKQLVLRFRELYLALAPRFHADAQTAE